MYNRHLVLRLTKPGALRYVGAEGLAHPYLKDDPRNRVVCKSRRYSKIDKLWLQSGNVGLVSQSSMTEQARSKCPLGSYCGCQENLFLILVVDEQAQGRCRSLVDRWLQKHLFWLG